MKYVLLKFKKDQAAKVAAFLTHLLAVPLFSWSEDEFFGTTIFCFIACTDEQITLIQESEIKNLIKSI
jgi:hypothetical protein